MRWPLWDGVGAQGEQALRRAAPGHVARVRERVFDRLTAEQAVSLGEIMRALETEAPESAPARTQD